MAWMKEAKNTHIHTKGCQDLLSEIKETKRDSWFSVYYKYLNVLCDSFIFQLEEFSEGLSNLLDYQHQKALYVVLRVIHTNLGFSRPREGDNNFEPGVKLRSEHRHPHHPHHKQIRVPRWRQPGKVILY